MLFWILLAIAVLNVFYLTFEHTGEILSLTLASVFSRDAKILFVSDAILIMSLFICVPYIKLIRYLEWPSRWLAPLQYIWEILLLSVVVVWTRHRNWPWVQSGFFVMHTLAMLMKIHSYATTNSFLADAHRHMKRTEKLLDEQLAKLGKGDIESIWDREVLAAIKPKQQAAFLAPDDTTDTTEALLKWGAHNVQKGTTPLRAKLREACEPSMPERILSPLPDHARISREIQAKHSSHFSKQKGDTELRDPHPLMWHPDENIRNLALEIARTREILLPLPLEGHGVGRMWPHNVTYANFWDFLLVPSLVYQLRYPRTNSISPLYIFERLLALAGTFFVVYVLVMSVIIPIVHSDRPIFAQFLHLMLPMVLCYLLLFYLVFECVCNGFAEITQFADREFYEDWWNSTSLDEFSRKWNKPVHHFLLQHVYVDSIYSYGMSKKMAIFITFFFSSVLHELVMIIVTGKWRGYLFMLQMSQIPLVMLARLPIMRRNPTFANFFFWFGLLVGPPMLNIGYLVF
ncbi:sterol O-acyltransferase [Malassezia cuniculi]|uniref:O-acyltransferase n=1 Tax=Malassezia cuniculi TaxID=948313 RepID=A0AAF0J6J0_9BASI|nr:sterol O-acyltransferase [Malassezia cuniculi]